jgi:hypothetical protein
MGSVIQFNHGPNSGRDGVVKYKIDVLLGESSPVNRVPKVVRTFHHISETCFQGNQIGPANGAHQRTEEGEFAPGEEGFTLLVRIIAPGTWAAGAVRAMSSKVSTNHWHGLTNKNGKAKCV